MEQQLVFSRTGGGICTWRNALHRFNPLPVFFAADKSPDNRAVVDIQRRACWIALAMVLQAINEAVYQIPGWWYRDHMPFIRPWQGTLSFTLILGSFLMMWMAFHPVTLRQQAKHTAKRPYRWQWIALTLALLTSIAGIIEFDRAVQMGFFEAPVYTNDGTSLDTNAAMLLMHGENPYTDSNMVHIAQLFRIEPNWTTPLREGQFADRVNYPSLADLRSAFLTDVKSGQAPEFEAKVSYPSLSFLTLIPFIWLGIYNVLPFYLLCYLGLVALGWLAVRREMRPWVVVFALANISMWSSVIGGNLDVLAILFLLMAWLWRDHCWRSALMLGLALACKQPSWFFVPFYAILMLRVYDWKEVIRRVTIAGLLMLALNLPFILWNAKAWFAGVMAPIGDPMFPMGVGIVGLVGSPFLHSYMPGLVYAVLEYVVFYPLCMLWYWRLCRDRPEAVMLLAVLPLFFAWRSLPSYFACAAFPMFILLASRGNTHKGSLPRRVSTLNDPARTNELVEALTGEREDLVLA